nr:immunoglobulin light chain junction region [Macaca mulatta]
CIQGLEFLWTF